MHHDVMVKFNFILLCLFTGVCLWDNRFSFDFVPRESLLWATTSRFKEWHSNAMINAPLEFKNTFDLIFLSICRRSWLTFLSLSLVICWQQITSVMRWVLILFLHQISSREKFCWKARLKSRKRWNHDSNKHFIWCSQGFLCSCASYEWAMILNIPFIIVFHPSAQDINCHYSYNLRKYLDSKVM